MPTPTLPTVAQCFEDADLMRAVLKLADDIRQESHNRNSEANLTEHLERLEAAIEAIRARGPLPLPFRQTGRPAPLVGPRTVEVSFYPGTGGEERLPVAYVAGYPRGPGGRCAFCHGDPTCEESLPDSPIARYFAAAPHASSCPVCDGRPS